MNPSTSPAEPKPISLARMLRDLGLLALAMILVAIPVCWFAWHSFGSLGLISAVAAGAICLGSCIAAMLIAALFRDPTQAVTGLVLGMGIRMGGPMLFLLYISKARPDWVEVGFWGQVLIFYLAGLAVETALFTRQLKSRDQKSSPNVVQDAAVLKS